MHTKHIMKTIVSTFIAVMLLLATPGGADEGMWTLDNLSIKHLQKQYGFTPTPQWIKHVQLASVRLTSGSGAFVSANGLLITNHHVAFGQIYKISTEEKDYVKDGYFARTRSEELKCPDLELDILMSIEDVTDRILGAVDPKATQKKQKKQLEAEIARTEKESMDKTGLFSQVVKLYQGGEYHLYRYKRYTDIRLVAAPEDQAAFFGGDLDNYTYPRYNLDFSFFRVYENGNPVDSKHYFKWSQNGAEEGELTFVIGNPGTTERLKTVAQLEFARDHVLPARIISLHTFSRAYQDYMSRGPEQKRRAQDNYKSIQNYIKRYEGMLKGLKDKRVMDQKKAQDEDLRSQVKENPELRKIAGESWDNVAEAQKKHASVSRQERFRNSWFSSRNSVSRLAQIAEIIVQYVEEMEKPNEERTDRFRDSNLESVRFRLFSPAPIYPDMDEHMLAVFFKLAKDELGKDDPFVRACLQGNEPKVVASELINGTKLADVEFRKKLISGGREVVGKCQDPLIIWAGKVRPYQRKLNKWIGENITSVETLEGGNIAKVRFAIYGKSIYPDATFTPRLTYGIVAGYEYGTTLIPYRTTFHSMYGRAAEFNYQEPFELPAMFSKNKHKVDMLTPVNFISKHDIVGGNSGSPVINKNLEYVGLVFDGNIHTLVWRYAYTDEIARCVSVHSSGILEALRIYGMDYIIEELTSESGR